MKSKPFFLFRRKSLRETVRSSYVDIPTVHFYFLGALADLVREDRTDDQCQCIHRTGPFTFVTNNHLVIIRYLSDQELSWVGKRHWQRIFYVIDDMLPIVHQCEELPVDYRTRLSHFVATTMPAILALQPTVVAPSPSILDLFPDHDGLLLDPCCLHPLSAPDHLSHHLKPEPPRIAFLGTRSHAVSLSLLEEVAAAMANRLPGSRLTLFFGNHLPRPLAHNKAIDNRRPLAWPAFREVIATERFHIALSPLPDTPFNRGRSITKVLDHAAVGAAGLYSNRPPFSTVIEDGVSGHLLSDHAQAWADALVRLAGQPEACRQMAEAGVTLAQNRGDPARLRSFWLHHLGLD